MIPRARLGPFRALGARYSSLFKPEAPKTTEKILEPLGQPDKPLISDNQGEQGDLIQMWKDLTNPTKNRLRRDEIKKEFAKTTFAPIYDYRNTGGKFFTCPPALFKPESAFYFPTIHGLSLSGQWKSTTQLLGTKPAIVRIFSTELAKNQVSSFTENLDLDGWSLIDINYQPKWVNHMLVKMFKKRMIAELQGPNHTHMIAKKGVSKEMLESLKATNPFGGYIYVVDRDLKIRWAGCGTATDDEERVMRAIVTRELK